MKLSLEVIVVLQCYFIGLTVTDNSVNFRYEKMHNFGLGRRVIQNYRTISLNGHEHPVSLPSTRVPSMALIKAPYRRLQQGHRRGNMDMRVFRKSFNYPPAAVGQRIMCESLLDCTITYISADTEEGIPIIFRGGVGYQHFSVIVRSKPGDALKGTVSVYCNRTVESDG